MRRRVGFLFICSAAIPIAIFASTAWACGALTTIKSNVSVSPPNGTVTVSGRNFGCTPNPSAVPPVTCLSQTGVSSANTPVQIRWNSRTGEVLKEVIPTAGAFTTTVKVPASATPGWYVLNATQFSTVTGAAKSGSPGRTTLRVQGAAVASNAPWGAAKPSASGGPGNPDLPLPGIILSAALLATGLTLVARGKGRKATRPALSA